MHDTPAVSTATPLEPGNVVTVEPGLYFPVDDEELPGWARGIGDVCAILVKPSLKLGGELRARPHETLFWTQDHYRVVRHGDWKLQRSGPNDEFVWLFDLAHDPTERHDLASERPDKVAELDAVLAAHLAEQAPPRWNSIASNPISIDKHLNQPEAPDDEYVYYPN